MSRMLSYVAHEPRALHAAVGEPLLAEFVALSRLHADGWGTAWTDPLDGAVHIDTGDTLDAGALPASWREPAIARIVYLRFASKGAPASPANAQPFLRGGVAFAHNGLLAPRERALELLPETQRRDLRGDTDSEVYFAVVRESGTTDARTLASGVARVRERFPDACLNAMVLSASGLHVVHAPGTARVPLAAFAERGFGPDRMLPADLPPGHDDDYNTLRTTVTAEGTRIVATTGIRQEGWTPLDREAVVRVTADGGLSARPASCTL